MIKSELIAKLAAENPHLTQKDVERVVGVILDSMTQALEDGGRVELRGFGAFSVRGRPARSGRNPRTGETVSVRAKAVPFFKSGNELAEFLEDAHNDQTLRWVAKSARKSPRAQAAKR